MICGQCPRFAAGKDGDGRSYPTAGFGTCELWQLRYTYKDPRRIVYFTVNENDDCHVTAADALVARLKHLGAVA